MYFARKVSIFSEKIETYAQKKFRGNPNPLSGKNKKAVAKEVKCISLQGKTQYRVRLTLFGLTQNTQYIQLNPLKFPLFMFNIANLSATEMLIMAVGAILLIFIVTRVAKFFFRILFFVAFIAALVFFWGKFKNNPSFTNNTNPPTPTNTTQNQPDKDMNSLFGNTAISELWQKDCANGTVNTAKCACLVVPIYNDLRTRYTEVGMQELEQSTVLMLNEMRKSLKRSYPQIEGCLKQRGNEGLKFLDVLNKF